MGRLHFLITLNLKLEHGYIQVIHEGEYGDRLFVVAEGKIQVSREGTALSTIGPGVVVGELAILYNCTRFDNYILN